MRTSRSRVAFGPLAGLLMAGPLLVGPFLVGVGPAAYAADCLQQIDNILVQYDLPASEAMAGTQTSAYDEPPPPGRVQTLPKEEFESMRRTPAGRPGAALLTGEGAAPPHGGPGLPVNKDLSAAQRKEILTVLHDARAADAMSNEGQCMDLVQKARTIIGKKKG